MIQANGKTYELTIHALDNMLKRDISAESVIEALENVEPYYQKVTGREIYDHFVEEHGETIQIRIVIEDDSLVITVMEVTE